MKTIKQETTALLAEFDGPRELLQCAEKLRDSGYKNFDCHSPFPIHGMDRAMGLKRSPLGWIVGFVAFVALAAGIGLEWWTSTVDYPLVISGKPFFSYQAYGPVAFAIMVLCSAFAALIGMILLNKLPQYVHPLFNSERFTRFSDDGFFISLELDETHVDHKKTEKLLVEAGGKNLEVIEEL
jgi:hypothetical protein